MSYVPPKKNTAYVFYVGLVSQADTKLLQVNPTIAAGDFKVSIDGGALANPASIPAVTPAGSRMVQISLSAAEMNGDNITVVMSDAAGAEWCDQIANLQTSVRQIDDLSTYSGGAVSSVTGNIGGNVTGTVGSVVGAVGSVTGSVGSVVGAVGSVTGAVGSVTGNIGGNLLGTLSSTERNAISDALLKRDWTLVTGEAARSCLNAFRLLRNKWSISAGTMTVTKEDDSTAAWTAALTVDATASPITSSDPT